MRTPAARRAGRRAASGSSRRSCGWASITCRPPPAGQPSRHQEPHRRSRPFPTPELSPRVAPRCASRRSRSSTDSAPRAPLPARTIVAPSALQRIRSASTRVSSASSGLIRRDWPAATPASRSARLVRLLDPGTRTSHRADGAPGETRTADRFGAAVSLMLAPLESPGRTRAPALGRPRRCPRSRARRRPRSCRWRGTAPCR